MPGEFYIEDKKLKSDLTEIKNTVTNIQNNITQVQTSIVEVENNMTTLATWIDLWSPYLAQVQLTTLAGDKSLPSITITGPPLGATVIRAVVMLKYRTLENTNAAVNGLSGPQNIQAQKAIDGVWVTGIALGGSECVVPTSTRESGDVMFGAGDIKSQIPANSGIMNFQWAGAKAAQNNLHFNDIQVGLRIWFTT